MLTSSKQYTILNNLLAALRQCLVLCCLLGYIYLPWRTCSGHDFNVSRFRIYMNYKRQQHYILAVCIASLEHHKKGTQSLVSDTISTSPNTTKMYWLLYGQFNFNPVQHIHVYTFYTSKSL